MIETPVWDKASKLICLNIEDFLKYFHIDYRRSGNRYVFACPLHEGDNENAAHLYNNKNHIVFKCFTNCPATVKKDGVSFIRGLLSRSSETSYSETVKFIYDFVDEKIPDIVPQKGDSDKYWFLDIVDDSPQNEGTDITKEQVRSRLLIPSRYYVSRNFDLKVLDDYDVGECNEKGKKFYNRAVIPCYDLSGKIYEGATSRSIYEKCPKCSYYHALDKFCPSTGFDYYKCSKWIHDGIRSGVSLFNTWGAAQEIRKTHKVVIVEGPGDVLRMAQAGVKNCLAVFGNTLKEGQTHILDSLGVMDVIVMFDNDKAGQKGCQDIKEKYNRMYRLYFPKYNAKDAGELNTDEITSELKPLLAQLGG